MTKVRRQKKRKTFNTSINRKRLRNRQRNFGQIHCEPINKAWNKKRSTKSNLRAMGLAYDPNKIVKIPNYKELEKEKAISVASGGFTVTPMEPKKYTPRKPQVIQELESMAKAPRECTLRLPKAQTDYLTYLMDKYGSDYKAMARDRKNYYQDTWKQLRAKIKKFMKIPKQYAEYLNSRGLLNKEIDEIQIKKEAEALAMDSD